MTHVKKFGLSTVLVALAAVAALAMLAQPASADVEGIRLIDDGAPSNPGPQWDREVIHSGNTVTVLIWDTHGDLAHAEFEIIPLGPAGSQGAAVFTANNTTLLQCQNFHPQCDDTWSAGDPPPGTEGYAIRTQIQTTNPGQVRINVNGYDGDGGHIGHRSIILTIVGSGGALVTISSDSDSIGRPSDVAGWDSIDDKPLDEATLTVNVKDNSGNNLAGVWVGVATVTPPSGNQTNLQLRSDDLPSWVDWTHGDVGCLTGSNGSCSVEARTTDSSLLGTHTIAAAVYACDPIYCFVPGGFTAWNLGGDQTDIVVAGPPENVEWTLSDPQGAATSQDVLIHVTDAEGRNAWTGLTVDRGAGDGDFDLLCQPWALRFGEIECKYLSTGVSTQPAILAVVIGGNLYDEHQIGNIIPGPTPPSGEFSIIPAAGGLTITSYTGTVASLAADGDALDLVSCFATVDGDFIGYVFGAPAFVNGDFADEFEDGLDEQGLICRRA